MSRKLMLLTALIIVLAGTLGLTFKVERVEAGGTICIRADGSIDGPANITTVDYVTYYFNESNYDEIVIERDNIIIDGAGHTVEGSGTGIGFDLTMVDNVTIRNTNIKNFENGVWLGDSSNNNIVDNNITANDRAGVRLDGSSNNSIVDNTIANNYDGIILYNASSNQFYHNNFVDNTAQVNIEVSGYGNFWNNTVEGNYWSDYNGTDSNEDGIGDTPYQIDANNTDNHPLMGVFSSFNTSVGKYVNVISNSTIDDFEYFQDNSTIRMYGSNMIENQTHGFCRICIPTALMNDTFRVFVNGTEILPPPEPLPCSNSTHNYLYFTYSHSTQKIVIIPEFPSFLIMPLFMTAILLTVIMYKRTHSE